MATFVLVPGAGGAAWYWHRVVPLLEQAQHEAIAVDLPGDDAHAGLSVYADRVLEAIGTREVILVAQSLGGFTTPLVCAQARVRMLVFVNAMIPAPGETAGSGGPTPDGRKRGSRRRTAAATARASISPPTSCTTCRPRSSTKARRRSAPRPTSCRRGLPIRAWPAVPIHVIAGCDDRFFPIESQRRVAQERLQVSVDELPGGHLLALANPRGLADQLLGYAREG
jgi:pimeloyl-ACP methyl ester carboxylesterase